MEKETWIMDSIHGLVNISEYQVVGELVSSRYFQRLRRLLQLGYAYLVYPGATHSRFSHCLGAMHVFLFLFDTITRRADPLPDQQEKRRIGAVTALLHDIGHGPFSHSSEAVLNQVRGGFSHEEMTCSIITRTEVADILKGNGIEPRTVCDLIRHADSMEWRLVSQLISSQLDADRLDYLVRDSYFTGVNYGKIEMHRIASTMEIWDGNTGDPFNGTAVIREKKLGAIEDYILSRHLMYENVYTHKIARCMEGLFRNLYRRASEMDDSRTGMSRIIDVNSEVTPEVLYGMDDYSCIGLFHEWRRSDDRILRDLALRILERRRLPSVTLSDAEYAGLGAEGREALRGAVEEAGFPSDYYYIEDIYEKSVYDNYSPEETEGEDFSPIGHIMTPDGDTLREISTQSRIIKALSGAGSRKIRIFVPEQCLEKTRGIIRRAGYAARHPGDA